MSATDRNGSSSSSRNADSSLAGDSTKRTPRSRLACAGCKSTKQKCDGPNASRSACRRCTTYGLTCVFPGSDKGVLYSAAPAPPQVTSAPLCDSLALAAVLEKISQRLESIETQLSTRSNSYQDEEHSNSESDDRHYKKRRVAKLEGVDEAKDEEQAAQQEDSEMREPPQHAGNNPLSEVTEIIERIVGYSSSMNGGRIGGADAVSQGLLSMGEAQTLFDFFIRHLNPWIMSFSIALDSDAAVVRRRSSLLFSTILLLASTYAAPVALHEKLTTHFLEGYGSHLLSPESFSPDFLKAVDLLNLYKPILQREGQGRAEAMVKSKVNGLSSWLNHVILSRTADRLEMSNTIDDFHRSYLLMQEMGIPIEEQVLSDLRLHLRLLSDDILGHVQSGRRCNMAGLPSTKTIRLFASLQYQTFDLRLVSMVELYDCGREILASKAYERTRKISQVDLDKFNVAMNVWSTHWTPILLDTLRTDPLAMTTISPFSHFMTLAFNASAYTTWKSGNALTQWEWECIEKSVRAAEVIVFGLCEESRMGVARLGQREVRWMEAERVDGYRVLVLDEGIVSTCRWGMDAITCITFIFPLIFLTKLFNDGLLTSDLVVLHTPTSQPPFIATRKLARLLELGSSFLDAIAPSADHPAKQQASLLKSLLQAGITGTPVAMIDDRRPSASPVATTSEMITAAPGWSNFEPSFSLLQHENHLGVNNAGSTASGARTPAIDFALSKLVDLSEFGEGFWEWNHLQ